MTRRTLQVESFSLVTGLAEGPTARAGTTRAEKKGRARRDRATRAGGEGRTGPEICPILESVRGSIPAVRRPVSGSAARKPHPLPLRPPPIEPGPTQYEVMKSEIEEWDPRHSLLPSDRLAARPATASQTSTKLGAPASRRLLCPNKPRPPPNPKPCLERPVLSNVPYPSEAKTLEASEESPKNH